MDLKQAQQNISNSEVVHSGVISQDEWVWTEVATVGVHPSPRHGCQKNILNNTIQ
jgi:hypothetical protein